MAPVPAPTYDVRRLYVDGIGIAYRDVGAGLPVVFFHGNPTSSYLWRGVMPTVAEQHRAIAPDLVGMGQSDKLPDAGPGTYRLATHQYYVDAFMAEVVAGRVVLVCHDWGGGVALDWARRHPERLRGIVYMETNVRPRSWAEEDEDGQAMFRALRSPAGEQMVLQDNFFVETLLPAATQGLSEEDLAVYRRPFAEPGAGRWPSLEWPREIPFDGEPADVHEVVAAYAAWLQASDDVPKLFIAAEPGALLTGAARRWCEALPNQQTVVVEAGHFVPEDAPAEVAAAVTQWLAALA